MTNWRRVQRHVDKGRRKAAQEVGQPIQIYRLGLNPLATNYLDPGNQLTPKLHRFSMFRKIPPKSNDVEQGNFDNITYDMIMDVHDLFPGDLILQKDPYFDDNTVFALGQKRPVHRNIGVRCERIIQIFRPATLGASPYAELQKSTALPLILSQGQFSFAPAGSTPTLIPAGFQSRERLFIEIQSDLPSSTKITNYFVYIPELPGITLREGDWVVEQQIVSVAPGALAGVGDPNAGVNAAAQYILQFGAPPVGFTVRKVYYFVQHPFHQPFGLTGYQMVCEKIDLP